MVRIVAKTKGGPLDGNFYSVVDGQTEIVGMDGMSVESVQIGEMQDDAGNITPVYQDQPVDKYIKDETTLRDFAGEEKGAFDLLFPDFNVTQICEFNYESGN